MLKSCYIWKQSSEYSFCDVKFLADVKVNVREYSTAEFIRLFIRSLHSNVVCWNEIAATILLYSRHKRDPNVRNMQTVTYCMQSIALPTAISCRLT
jgi:hypothetical protein